MSEIYTELLVGAGSRHEKLIKTPGRAEWENLITSDINVSHDVDWFLNILSFPFRYIEAFEFKNSSGDFKRIFDDSFNEIHAYEVLEHTGAQGDYHFFFEQFSEFHRILKPGGLLCAIVPDWRSEWAWGDPSHTRVITPGTLVFLSQKEYEKQVGKTAMSDFRNIYKADFDILWSDTNGETFAFVLRAVK